MLWRAKQHPD